MVYMLKEEFETLAGYKVSIKDYEKIIEPMYLATNLDKVEFVKTLNRSRFEVTLMPIEEELQKRKEIDEEYKRIKKDIQFYKEQMDMYKSFLQEEMDEEKIIIQKLLVVFFGCSNDVISFNSS